MKIKMDWYRGGVPSMLSDVACYFDIHLMDA